MPRKQINRQLKRILQVSVLLLLIYGLTACADNATTPTTPTTPTPNPVVDNDNDGVNSDTDPNDNDACVPNTNSAACQTPTEGNFKITIRYIDTNLSAAKKLEVEQAVRRWEEIITADLADVNNLSIEANQCDDGDENLFPMPFSGSVDDLQIDVAAGTLDGAGGTLAFAGPCVQRQDGRQLPVYGVLFIDSEDANDASFIGTIVHELGHVLGIGTLWEQPSNDYLSYTGKTADTRCDDLNPIPNDLGYTAPRAVAEYAALGGTGNVPVENGVGPGSNCGHWREAVFNNELMDSSANAPDDPLSRLTIAALDDLGYKVDYSKAEAYTIPTCSPNCLETTSTSRNWEKILYPKFKVDDQGNFESLR